MQVSVITTFGDSSGGLRVPAASLGSGDHTTTAEVPVQREPSPDPVPGSRFGPIEPSAYDADQRSAHDAIVGARQGSARAAVLDEQGRLRGAYAAMVLQPRVGAAMQELGVSLRFGGLLSERAREICILVAAAHWDSSFQWAAHEPIALGAGLSAHDLAAIRSGKSLQLVEAEDVAALGIARALVRHWDVSDDEYDRYAGVLGEARTFEVCSLVGYYSMLALTLRTFRLG